MVQPFWLQHLQQYTNGILPISDMIFGYELMIDHLSYGQLKRLVVKWPVQAWNFQVVCNCDDQCLHIFLRSSTRFTYKIFGVINPLSWIFTAVSNEKSNSLPSPMRRVSRLQCSTLTSRTVQFFRLLNLDCSIQVRLQNAKCKVLAASSDMWRQN